MEYTNRPTVYDVEAHNGRKWIKYGRPYEDYLMEVVNEALDMGFSKVRYRTIVPDGKRRWYYAYNGR